MKNLKLNQSKINKVRRAVSILMTALFILSTCILPVFAADGNEAINSFTKIIDLVFLFVRLVGIVFTVWGMVEFATAWQAHDGAGRIRGITLVASGLLIVFAKEILTYAGVTY